MGISRRPIAPRECAPRQSVKAQEMGWRAASRLRVRMDFSWAWRTLETTQPASGTFLCTDAIIRHSSQDLAHACEWFHATLEATQVQMDGFFSQLPSKCRHNRVASVGD